MIAIQLRFTTTFTDETEQVKACAKILDKIYKDIKAAEAMTWEYPVVKMDEEVKTNL